VGEEGCGFRFPLLFFHPLRLTFLATNERERDILLVRYFDASMEDRLA